MFSTFNKDNKFVDKNEINRKIKFFRPITKLSLFGLFQYYWYTVQRRGMTSSSLLVLFIMTSYIFDCLRKEWVEKRGYSLEDLKYITSGMDVLYNEFDSRPFVNNSNLFIKKLKEFKKN